MAQATLSYNGPKWLRRGWIPKVGGCTFRRSEGDGRVTEITRNWLSSDVKGRTVMCGKGEVDLDRWMAARMFGRHRKR